MRWAGSPEEAALASAEVSSKSEPPRKTRLCRMFRRDPHQLFFTHATAVGHQPIRLAQLARSIALRALRALAKCGCFIRRSKYS